MTNSNPYYNHLAQYGRFGDNQLAHLSPAAQQILRANGGSGSINPATGLPEYFNIGGLLKTVVGTVVGGMMGGPVGAAIGGGLGNAIGNKGNFAENFVKGGLQGFIGNGAFTGNWGFAQTAGLNSLLPSMGSVLGGAAAGSAMGSGTPSANVHPSQVGQIMPGNAFGNPSRGMEVPTFAGTTAKKEEPSFMMNMLQQGKDTLTKNPMQTVGLGLGLAQALLGKEERRADPDQLKDWEELKRMAQVRPYMKAIPYELPKGLPAYAEGGLIPGHDAGQSDKIPEDLEEEDFIIPADVVAHQGDGNTLAGAHRLDEHVNALMQHAHRLQHHAHGGHIRHHLNRPTKTVPAMVSSGEYHIPRVAVLAQGNGNPKKGAQDFYNYMKNIRKHKATSKFPPKAKHITAYMGGR